MTRRVLVVFAKLPEAGKVKTRMTPPLSSAEAAELYERMLGDVLETSAAACRSAAADLVVSLTPSDRLFSFADLFVDSPALKRAKLIAQCEGDLGLRMGHAFDQAAAAGYDRIVLRGSDSPALPEAQLVEAFEALETVDLAIGPDVDGGYNWIAAHRGHRGLFDHEMSTASVSAETLSNANRLGLRSSAFSESFDLDTAGDLDRLRSIAPDLAAGLARRTLAWLDDFDARTEAPA